MSYLTLSENVTALLIRVADGQLATSLGQTLDLLDTWQQIHDCHIGTCRSDIGSSLHLLWFEDTELDKLCPSSCEEIRQLTLLQVLPVLLKYKHWYSNDEAAYWETASSRGGTNEIPEFQATSFRTHQMRGFLASDPPLNPGQLMKSLDKLGLTDSHLRLCARMGPSS